LPFYTARWASKVSKPETNHSLANQAHPAMENRVRYWRQVRGLSQEALGRMVGLSKPTISKLERGDLRLRDVTIAKLVEALRVSAGELLGDYASGAGEVPLRGRAAKKPGRRKGSASAHFGDRAIDASEKARLVHDVFSAVAPQYDLMNDLMSAGIHRLWKAEMIDLLKPRPGMCVVDVAGGTGDIAIRILERIDGPESGAFVTVCDVNEAMLQRGRDRAIDKGICASIHWLCGDAEELPITDACADAYTIAFGMRNLTHIDRALSEARRVLKPGGRFLCLEFSRVAYPAWAEIYDAYSFKLLPALGEFVAGNRAAYQYLVESIRRFPDQERFAAMIAAAKLGNVHYRNLSGGIAALHSAWRV
jgi:demethylmenaquinone methyltransferase / 2-methoxy-6-polyprenyl-1,4-benzoquinol methylase